MVPREYSTGGGNLLIHINDISILVIQKLCNHDFEIVTCSVVSLNYHIYFFCCCRPPSGNLQLFLEEFGDFLVKFLFDTVCVVVISMFTSTENVELRLISKIFPMSLDWCSQLNYLLIGVVTLLILSLDHKT